MNDTTKHSVGFLTTIASATGSLSLQGVNEWGSLICWLVGTAAGICTIHSWVKKQKRDKDKDLHHFKHKWPKNHKQHGK
jgi:hypothetical protein